MIGKEFLGRLNVINSMYIGIVYYGSLEKRISILFVYLFKILLMYIVWKMVECWDE